MRLFISKAAAFALCVCALAACSPQDGSAPAAKSTTAASGSAPAQVAKQPTRPQTATTQAGDTRRVTIEETQKAIEEGTAVVVDVRDASSYKTSHIKSAKSIPLQQFDARIGELPKDKLIITYCA
jgi:3-mercaptopyruvate sulfurtransferase SseA